MNMVSEFEWRAQNANVFYPFGSRPHVGALDLTGLWVDAQVQAPAARVRLACLTEKEPDQWLARLEGEEPYWLADVLLTLTPCPPWRLWSGEGLRLLSSGDVDWSGLSGRIIEDAWFVPHVMNAEPRRLESLTVNGERLTGRIGVEAGYNMQVEPADRREGVRPVRAVSLGVMPGAGAGLEPCAAGDCRAAVKSINDQRPNGVGNFILDGVDCYNVSHRLAKTSDGAAWRMAGGELQLSNSCGPCCDCADYGYMYGEVLSGLWDRARALSSRHAELKRLYGELSARHAELAACMARPVLELRVTGMFNRSAAVALGLRNNSSAPWPARPAGMSITIRPENGQLVDDTVGWYDGGSLKPLQHEWRDNVFTCSVSPVPCCSTAWVVFNLAWPGAGGFVEAEASAQGDLDGVAYALAAREATKMPVNRMREE